MTTNKYAGKCRVCGVTVPARSGQLVKHGEQWGVNCQNHIEADHALPAFTPRRTQGRYRSTYARFSSGAEVYTNSRGRCEDAPCCGCCS